MSPVNTAAPDPSLISTLCGTASLLSKSIVNAVSAGAVTSVCSKAMPMAEISTAWAAGADADAPALALGAADAGALAEAPADAPADGASEAPAEAEGPPEAPADADGAAVGGA